MTIQTAGLIPEWTLGWRMQRALAHGDLSVQQMADTLGVSRSTISRWLHDDGRPPRAAFISQWALATGVPRKWLETGETPTGGDPDGGLENVAPPTGLEPVTLWFTRSRVAKDMLLGQHEPYRIAA